MNRLKPCLVGVTILLWLLIVLVGCGGDNSSASTLRTFENGLVSLELPDSFVGGDPRDPAVMAELEKRAADDRNHEAPWNADFSLQLLKENIQLDMELGLDGQDRVASSLRMLGPSDIFGATPVVTVESKPLESFLLHTEETPSMRAVIDAVTVNLPEADSRTETVSGNRALLVLHYLENRPYPMARVDYYVFVLGDDCLYLFNYSGEQSTSLETVFRESAETATVKGF